MPVSKNTLAFLNIQNIKGEKPMKVKVIRKIFFNGTIVQPGSIVNIKSDSVPVWGKAVDKNFQTPDKTQTSVLTKTPVQPEQQGNPTSGDPVEQNTNPVNYSSDLEGKTEAELLKILDNEITKAVEKNIMIEDADKKSSVEQIIEIRTKLAELEA